MGAVKDLTSTFLRGMPKPYVARAQSSQRLRDLGLGFRALGFRGFPKAVTVQS